MPKKISNASSLQLNLSYQNLLTDIKERLKKAQIRAAITVNHELIKFYWEVGNLIIQEQKNAQWGDRLFDALSNDLRRAFPNTEGFSKTNLKYMRLFAHNYPNGEFGQALPDQLTWTHHIVLIQAFSLDQVNEKKWYAYKTIENEWSYRELQKQIKSDLFSRQSKIEHKTTNFIEKLPSPQSHLAQEMIKDPYKFHFLSVGDEAHEKDIHNGLLTHVKEFLMELGQGFALYGTRYPIVVSGKRFEIDLLMYNTKLHVYVVVELKRGELNPKDTGQLNFYLSAVDEQLKMPEDGPTIGLLLCEKKDKVIAEYSLRRVSSPMGIAEYELSQALTERLNHVLPTTEEIETELSSYALSNKDLGDDDAS
ncbi:YhcG family protein [Legionella genomosp. 1]|uniref:PDDEXK nuclease domain-containing protein n=1 Tax=Legionella genomosp. 1 TaxID=1093625 RepID=UPI0010563A16|nr:PDDEXK nuclease domain-containing protein [Legionella genomosp. 1]